MPTECTPDFFGFEPVEGREVVAAFDAGAITSDAGAQPPPRSPQAPGFPGQSARFSVDDQRLRRSGPERTVTAMKFAH
jgi:hypothetical protein